MAPFDLAGFGGKASLSVMDPLIDYLLLKPSRGSQGSRECASSRDASATFVAVFKLALREWVAATGRASRAFVDRMDRVYRQVVNPDSEFRELVGDVGEKLIGLLIAYGLCGVAENLGFQAIAKLLKKPVVKFVVAELASNCVFGPEDSRDSQEPQ